jgi:hypothetical protein
MDKKTELPQLLKDDLLLIWGILKNLVFFLGIYLFFLGWLYLFFYFKRFGVSLTSISLDIPSYYNYGFFALMKADMLILFFVFFVAFFLIYYKRQHLRYSYFFVLILIVLFFTFSYLTTKGNAQQDALAILTKKNKLHPIYFDFTADFIKSMSKDSAEWKLLNTSNAPLTRTNIGTGAVKLLHYNNQLELFEIYENSETHFVIHNFNTKGSLTKDVELFNVNKKNINYATKLMSYK